MVYSGNWLHRFACSCLVVLPALLLLLLSGADAAQGQPQRFSFWSVNPGNKTVTKYVRIGSAIPTAQPGTSVTLSYIPSAIVATNWIDGETAGQRIYISDTKDQVIWQYIADQNGHLNPLNPPSVRSGRLLDMCVDSLGSALYVIRADGPTSFKILDDGTLRPLQPTVAPVDSVPVSMALTPNGANLYVVGSGGKVPGAGGRLGRPLPSDPSGSISQYTIATDGTVTPLDPPIVGAGDVPCGVAVDRTGRFAYAINRKSENLTQFKIDDGGALEPLDPDTVDLSAPPSAIFADPSRPFIYVLIGQVPLSPYSAQLVVLKIGRDGDLTQVDGPDIPAQVNIKSCFFDAATLDLYLVGNDGNVANAYQLNDNGKPIAFGAHTAPKKPR